jgi:mannose-6-phosphate isomerase-like protein (cupin superfamily)
MLLQLRSPVCYNPIEAQKKEDFQAEWFYALEGEFSIEVGQERITLKPGDSLLAPRKVPHVWAYVGATRGRILIAFMPAGKDDVCN